ncbi:MAG: hypothetical protein CVU56_23455 [Deltaproteobacteria bacterium HGW-Deltaproteobacteria-14]|jgi:rhomboid protease GluP|nr:MAG: hypothetical protein CVU56_23455 [Deltaproteobacteria bacterium HGW-Deltaproteobacteria-14]
MVTPSPSDANGRRLWLAPAITGALTALALAAVYLVTVSRAGGALDADALVALGAKVDPEVAAGQWWRLVTSVFLHAGGMHLALNAIWLALFTAGAAALIGPARAVATGLLGGVAGQLLSFAVSMGPSVGASGAVFALAGTLLAVVWRRRERLAPDVRWRLLASLGAATAALLFFPLTAGAVDHAAHVGGFVAGAALGALPERRIATAALCIAAVGISALALLSANS